MYTIRPPSPLSTPPCGNFQLFPDQRSIKPCSPKGRPCGRNGSLTPLNEENHAGHPWFTQTKGAVVFDQFLDALTKNGGDGRGDRIQAPRKVPPVGDALALGWPLCGRQSCLWRSWGCRRVAVPAGSPAARGIGADRSEPSRPSALDDGRSRCRRPASSRRILRISGSRPIVRWPRGWSGGRI